MHNQSSRVQMRFRHKLLCMLFATVLGGCGPLPWNSPYPADEDTGNTLYSAFTERPNHLDPAQSYSSNEVVFTGQIYEPPLQYHYFKRPYTLIPLAATSMPQAMYIDARGQRLPADAAAAAIAYSVYTIRIKPGIRYQPHPAFARDAQGRLRYHSLTAQDLASIDTLADFAHTGTRELVAADYIYEIKRLAHPSLHSPLFGLMSEYIVGLKDYAKTLQQTQAKASGEGASSYLDLQRYPLAGAETVNRYTYRIIVHGKYPQFIYWLAMPFFAPVPPEAERFYNQPGMAEKNLTLDWYPVGTGPYMLSVNNPNRQMVLERNPNFHGEVYPEDGLPPASKLLRDAGKALPFVDRVVYSLEQEDIPYWNKFLQGYYDVSGISSDSFDQAIQLGGGGEASLTEDMQDKGIRLQTDVGTSIFYMGFNMRDPVVGGLNERARKLRQALSIALDQEEYISIFLNGRGIPAQGPLPPGIIGHVEGQRGINPYMYTWNNGRPLRKSLAEARRLLKAAGYADGIDARTGTPLLLYLDTTAGGPDDKARLDWLRKQFARLNIQLVVRDSDYNRFQDKMLKGTAQLFQWGWNADYPDPENFLFLLYGPNAKVGKNGENAANYDNPAFNRLFLQMKSMDNGPERSAIIAKMIAILRHDAPWIWGFHPKQFSLYHAWYHNAHANQMVNNGLKYKRVDAGLRARSRAAWNKAVVWPLWTTGALFLLGVLPAVLTYVRRERTPAAKTAKAR